MKKSKQTTFYDYRDKTLDKSFISIPDITYALISLGFYICIINLIRGLTGIVIGVILLFITRILLEVMSRISHNEV